MMMDPPEAKQSIHAITRALKKEESGVYNCILSCVKDWAFVAEIARIWQPLPLLSNLRCGSWHTRYDDGTCRFKSMDGHNNEWNFSLARLNMHVADLAAERKGVVIVDATRRGKTFPDSLTKTVPIWACVLNRALHRLRQREPQPAAAWDTELHLPPQITRVEREKICERLEGWVDLLLCSGPDLSSLSRGLQKPLRPLWVSTDTFILTNLLPTVEDLDFTPLVLVSASQQRARPMREVLELEGEPFAFSYLPGAGDDEESWSRGLTPGLLRQHTAELIRSGPDGIEATIDRILAGVPAHLRKARHFGQSKAAAAAASVYIPPKGLASAPSPASQASLSSAPLTWLPLLPHLTSLALQSNDSNACLTPAVWDSIDFLLNVGDRSLPASTTGSLDPITSLSPTPSLSAVTAFFQLQGVSLPAFEGNPSIDHAVKELRRSPGGDKTYLHLPLRDNKHERHVLQHRLDFLVRLLYHREIVAAGRRVLVVDDRGVDLCVGVALALLSEHRGTAVRSKEAIRAVLADIARAYPAAQPRQATLKEVFKYFIHSS